MTLRSLSESLVEILRNNSTLFGIPIDESATRIMPGNVQLDIPQSAPFIYVYCLPGNFLNSTQTAYAQIASVAITCAVGINQSTYESIIVSHEMCVQAMQLLNRPQTITSGNVFINAKYAEPPIEFDNITDTYTSCKLLFTTTIDL